ncbi:MAG: Fic family protein [Flavobacteriales bacterium]
MTRIMATINALPLERMKRVILTDALLDAYTRHLGESPVRRHADRKPTDLPADYFAFYTAVSSVYSSKIEGEDIDFNSYFKHRFQGVEFERDYTKRIDDLEAAYRFIAEHDLTPDALFEAHARLSANLLPKHSRGKLRRTPMFVMSADDRIEYVAADHTIVGTELERLFSDIDALLSARLNDFEVFYYAAMIHLVFVKIHPFDDGNGRAARLLEKWFLKSKLGTEAWSIELEKNYFNRLPLYYSGLKKIGFDYTELDYTQALDFLLMTAEGILRR